MNKRSQIILAVLLSAAVSGPSAKGTSPPFVPHVAARPGAAALHAFGSRTQAQQHAVASAKLDAALAELDRHWAKARPDHLLADLHALSPAAHFKASVKDGAAMVLIDAVTRGDPQLLETTLVSLGLEHAAVFSNDVGGWLPLAQLDAAAASDAVHSIRAAMMRPRSASVSAQGDYAQRSDVIRSSYPALTGSGITLGILSDSFNCYAVYAQNGVPASGNAGYASNGFLADAAADEASGALPAVVNVLWEADCMNYGAPDQLPFTDEGRAMLQIAHAVAPGANLAFYTGDSSEADFATGIGALATAGATIEADDLGYFDEPFFQDGILAQAINQVEARGVAYFSAAGNDANISYENTAPAFTTQSTAAPNSGEYLLNFDATGNTTTTLLPVTIPALFPGEYVGIVVEWDQPYVTGAPASGGATSQIDVCVTGAAASTLVINLDGQSITCTGPNALGTDAVQVVILGNPANASGNTALQQVNVAIGLANGTSAPGRIKLVVEGDGAAVTIDSFATNSPTLQGHPGAAGAAAVGAAFFFDTPRCGTTPATLETFSSEGGDPILFDSTGTRLATPVVRQKPDFVAPDGVNNTFLGYTLAQSGVPNGELSTTNAECQNNPSYPNFFGTSAATPHAAAVAALMRQANAGITPAQIYTALQQSALPMTGAPPSFSSGYGFIQADAALAMVPIGPPVLTLSASTVSVGYSVTLAWAAPNATSCTASGSWSGSQTTSGTLTLSPTAAGTPSYTLTCSNGASSEKSTVSLAVNAVTATATAGGGGGGGGGSFGAVELLILGTLTTVCRARRRPAARSA